MINERLVWYLEKNNIITEFQSGFRHQRSTNDHLVRLETFIREAFIKKEHLVAVFFDLEGGGRVVRRCWVNFQCWGVLLIWIIVGQGPIVLAVGAGGGCLDIFSLIYHFSFLSPSLWETARYRLKYCLKGPLSPKQPTNQL